MIRVLIIVAVAAAVATLIRALVRPRRPFLPEPGEEVPDSAEEPTYDGSEELVALLSSPDPVVIEAYRGALHSAGIPTIVFDEASSRMFGHLPAVAMRLMVPTSRFRAAQAVIDDLEPGTFSEIDEA